MEKIEGVLLAWRYDVEWDSQPLVVHGPRLGVEAVRSGVLAMIRKEDDGRSRRGVCGNSVVVARNRRGKHLADIGIHQADHIVVPVDESRVVAGSEQGEVLWRCRGQRRIPGNVRNVLLEIGDRKSV